MLQKTFVLNLQLYKFIKNKFRTKSTDVIYRELLRSVDLTISPAFLSKIAFLCNIYFLNIFQDLIF